MKTLILLIVTLFYSVFCNAQSFKETFASAQKQITEVQVDKNTISQSLEKSPNDPFAGQLNISETDSKGKTTKYEYIFNFAFLDDSKLEIKTSKSQLTFICKTRDKFKAIAVTKNGEPDKYTDAIEIQCENIDMARGIEKDFKTLISDAKKNWETTLKIPADYIGLSNYIQKAIKNFEMQGVTAKQSAVASKTFKDRAVLNVEVEENKKTKSVSYDFSWGDLNEKEISLGTDGLKIEIEVKTAGKENYILEKEDSKSAYTSSLKLYVANPTDGRALQMAIEKYIPLAKKELLARIPKTPADGFEGLKYITSFSQNDLQFDQSISKNCVTEYISKATEKGKTQEMKLVFNFSDIEDYKMDIGKKGVSINAKAVNKSDFITSFKNDKQTFENKLEFTLEDVEKARYFMVYLPVLTAKCKQNIKIEGFEWISKKLAEAGIEDFEQKLEYQEGGDKGKWKLTTIEKSSKKNKESVYEFNLTDLDPNKLEFASKSNTFMVAIEIKNKEKYIKTTVDGKPGFTSNIDFKLKNVEDAKVLSASIKQMVGKK